ncbi:hypothetical protein KP509_26G050900 [Ceratopteris richardii]|uniref:Uncharacterized protein n=2 Tax=Ceratopteris richardii TaxID=49495 RepID=A0A8T2RKV3_CERRI|nr:hypothetical protein KP509_26G050900 [Ceratopteris richardii]
MSELSARETASKVATKKAKTISDMHKASNGLSGTQSATEAAQKPEQSKAVNEVAIRLQKWKEARDCSFLSIDEDPRANTTFQTIQGEVVQLKSVTHASLESKLPRHSEMKCQISDVCQKCLGSVTIGHGSSTEGHYNHKEAQPLESVSKSKTLLKPPSRIQKRARKTDFKDPFQNDVYAHGDITKMIRRIFGYNPNKYHDMDYEDDRLMQADFHTIQMEEKRSARIAREEDARELALMKEEERRKRKLDKEHQKRCP